MRTHGTGRRRAWTALACILGAGLAGPSVAAGAASREEGARRGTITRILRGGEAFAGRATLRLGGIEIREDDGTLLPVEVTPATRIEADPLPGDGMNRPLRFSDLQVGWPASLRVQFNWGEPKPLPNHQVVAITVYPGLAAQGAAPAPAGGRQAISVENASLADALDLLKAKFGLKWVATEEVLKAARLVTLKGEFSQDEAQAEIARQAGVEIRTGEDGVVSVAARSAAPAKGEVEAGKTAALRIDLPSVVRVSVNFTSFFQFAVERKGNALACRLWDPQPGAPRYAGAGFPSLHRAESGILEPGEYTLAAPPRPYEGTFKVNYEVAPSPAAEAWQGRWPRFGEARSHEAIRHAGEVVDRWRDRIHAIPGVVSSGSGLVGPDLKGLGISIGVLDEASAGRVKAAIPNPLEGVPVEVRVTGPIRAQAQ